MIWLLQKRLIWILRILLALEGMIGSNHRKGGYLMNWLSRLALFLVIIGALNWLLVGLFEWDLVSAVFGGETMRASSMLSRIVYSLVGLSGLYCLTFLFADTIVGTEQR